MTTIIKAPSKINLAIDVLNKREDGYHDIDIVTLPLQLHDCLELEVFPAKYGTFLTCDDNSIICDESNLVYKAYRLMKKKYKFDSGMRIKIYKNIPVEAGLGGGSADAAALINGLNKIFKLKMTDQEKIDIAIQIGSDVPYCLFNRPARMRYKGDQLDFIDVKKNWAVLLIQPDQGLSTGGVYKVSDTIKGDKPDIEKLIEGLKLGDDKLIQENMKNGLQNASISILPEIKILIDKLKEEGLTKVMMSGSGSTVFALDEDVKKLKKIAKKFEDEHHSVWISKTCC